MNKRTLKEQSIRDYMDYEVEELEEILKYPNEIEVGHTIGRDELIEEEIRLIKEALRRKELVDEHQGVKKQTKQEIIEKIEKRMYELGCNPTKEDEYAYFILQDIINLLKQ